jgi:DNA (cytosine-5)-methyltransferase 1
MKPLAIDLFCGAGGVARGLQRAGFFVVGVDIKPQRRYAGDLFVQADALNPPLDLQTAEFVWASPPCQHASAGTAPQRKRGMKYPELIEPTRAMLEGHPCWCIENVVGSALRTVVELDGTMFGLGTIRRRRFETSFLCLSPLSARRPGDIARGKYIGITDSGPSSSMRAKGVGYATFPQQRAAMGIDWMTGAELSQAIPPAYAEFIGRAAMAVIQSQMG